MAGAPGEQSGAVVVAVDGSEVSLRAAVRGLALLDAAANVVVVTVIEASDPTLVTGTGFAGGVMSAEDFDRMEDQLAADAYAVGQQAAAALDRGDATIRVERGDPGRTLCELAERLDARALVLGSRGKSGISRAVLGSVSDYVVRNAPCPVVVSGPGND